jgi:hypothetical protein
MVRPEIIAMASGCCMEDLVIPIMDDILSSVDVIARPMKTAATESSVVMMMAKPKRKLS